MRNPDVGAGLRTAAGFGRIQAAGDAPREAFIVRALRREQERAMRPCDACFARRITSVIARLGVCGRLDCCLVVLGSCSLSTPAFVLRREDDDSTAVGSLVGVKKAHHVPPLFLALENRVGHARNVPRNLEKREVGERGERE